jgi:pilus assembly protein CpaF
MRIPRTPEGARDRAAPLHNAFAPGDDPPSVVLPAMVRQPGTGGQGNAVEVVRARLAAGSIPPRAAVVAAALRDHDCRLDPEALDALATSLCEQALDLDPIARLIADPRVTDVLVNAPDEVWVERADRLERVEVTFRDEAGVRRYAQRLATQAGRRLDDASPFVDARLPDGARLHAVLPPLAAAGTTISLRVARRRAFTLDELRRQGAVNLDGARLLAELIRRRLPFLVTGGAGTGKTTLLSSLLSLADPGERLILVEDCAELTPEHPHVVRLESRPPNQEGRGEITVRDLIRQALRMRPTRLVLGEARGPEVLDLLTALNTGHEGGCGTLHANRPQEVPARLEALGLLAGVSREAVHSQAAAALRVVVHLERDEFGRRYLQSIGVLRRRSSVGPVQVTVAVTFDRSGQTREWSGYPALLEELGHPVPPPGPAESLDPVPVAEQAIALDGNPAEAVEPPTASPQVTYEQQVARLFGEAPEHSPESLTQATTPLPPQEQP